MDYYKGSFEIAVLASAVFTTQSLEIASLPFVGVTNNVSESYNRVLKDFQNWKVSETLKCTNKTIFSTVNSMWHTIKMFHCCFLILLNSLAEKSVSRMTHVVLSRCESLTPSSN